MIISLLELSRNHLNELKDTLLKSKFPTPNGQDLIYLYTQNSPNLEEDIQKGILNNAIYYFRTLKYIESVIIKESWKDKVLLNNYIGLLESQITDNLRELHWLLLGIKNWIDRDKITFKYIFNNTMIEPKKKVEEKIEPVYFNAYQ